VKSTGIGNRNVPFKVSGDPETGYRNYEAFRVFSQFLQGNTDKVPHLAVPEARNSCMS